MNPQNVFLNFFQQNLLQLGSVHQLYQSIPVRFIFHELISLILMSRSFALVLSNVQPPLAARISLQ